MKLGRHSMIYSEEVTKDHKIYIVCMGKEVKKLEKENGKLWKIFEEIGSGNLLYMTIMKMVLKMLKERDK